MFFFAKLIYAIFVSLIMALLFGIHYLNRLQALLLIKSLNVLLKTGYYLIMFNRNECLFTVTK